MNVELLFQIFTYIRLFTGGQHILAHRAAFLFMEGYLPEEVDHSDGNGCNNKWHNLASSDRKSNAKNLRRRSDNTSGVTGVSFCNKRGKWVVMISIDGKSKNLGRFSNFQYAVRARLNAQTHYNFHSNHGEDRPL